VTSAKVDITARTVIRSVHICTQIVVVIKTERYSCFSPNVYGVNCNIQCNSLCRNRTCDRWTGQCHLKWSSLCETCGASSGKCTKCREPIRYGDRCQNQCNAGCAYMICNHLSGECFACNDGLYGSFCNVSCSSAC